MIFVGVVCPSRGIFFNQLIVEDSNHVLLCSDEAQSCLFVSAVSASAEEGIRELSNVLNMLPKSIVNVMKYLFSFLNL